jgi:hypothetical protein
LILIPFQLIKLGKDSILNIIIYKIELNFGNNFFKIPEKYIYPKEKKIIVLEIQKLNKKLNILNIRQHYKI